MLTIDIDTARRFILGKQGLWPGPRWRGLAGVEQAMAAMEYLQLDPLQIIARSQDITLHSRVLDTTPGMWEDAAYQRRKFFDWGGWLAVRPMDELPHWRVVMRRERDDAARIRAMARDHADAIVEMRAILRERGAVSNRDFADGNAHAHAKLSRPQGQRVSVVLSVAHRRSDDAPPRALRARLRAHRNGRAGASHPRERRGRG